MLVAAAAGGLVVGTLAVPASAAQTGAPKCHIPKDNITYYGDNRVNYHSISSTLWRLDSTDYKFSPANSNSTANNQNLDFYGGSSHYTLNSNDSLVRDDSWRPGVNLAPHSVNGQKGFSHMTYTDIFDVPNSGDPSSSTTGPDF